MTKTSPSRPRKRFRSTLAWGIVLIALCGLGAWYWFSPTEAATARYLTTSVSRGDVQTTVLATGTLKPSRWVAVGAQVSGQVESLKVALGDHVSAGDVVAEIDSVTQENDLRSAEASLQDIRAQLQEKQANQVYYQKVVDRAQGLRGAGISEADLDEAEMQLATTTAQMEALKAQITQAEVTVSTAQANLDYTRITSPIDGTIISIVTQEGQTVNASQSAPTIVIVAQLDTMTVRADIAETDVVSVYPGQEAWFTILGDRKTRYRAQVKAIEPAPEDVTSDSSLASSSSSSSSSSDEAIYYVGTFDVPNPDGRLLTYMTAEVHIVTGESRDVLTVPSSAVSGQGQRSSVTVLNALGQPEVRKVTIGLDNGTNAEVTEGLKEGDTVVLGQSGEATTSGTPRGMGGFGGPPMGRR